MLTVNETLVLRVHVQLKAFARRSHLANGYSINGAGQYNKVNDTEYNTAVDSLVNKGYIKRNKAGATTAAQDYNVTMNIVNAAVTALTEVK